ncbi:hypothetical protein HUT19_18695 [Streptomyces sp. NA02950]|uniref:hypothetical protein n=1 Tax=Streptomyces sp. NA02950 TaxID=2742137 RepID=UPI00159235C0|nr:hypothetical protein [Streptomyces sp. NA02950]QKV93541.1 hypothetical protein HUT19_18695 [Streptomyces sp. NA02950]
MGEMTWCADGDRVSVRDTEYDGYAFGVRISDGSGRYRWCKDTSGADDTWKRCNVDLRENTAIEIRGSKERSGHRTIWFNTHTFSH